MAIIEKLTKSSFINEFRNRCSANFSYDGLAALYDHFEHLSESMETDIEFDPVAICCEYHEYQNLDELKAEYDSIYLDDLEDLEVHTLVLPIDGTDRFIIQQF